MDLLAPKGLWLLTLLVPLVVLYILKIKRQRKLVSSTWLWAAAQRDLMARAPFKKLIAQIPLLLQAIVLAALAFALARPSTRGREFTGDHLAIVIDASASMAAKTGGTPTPPDAPTRMDLAKATAKEILSAMTPGSDALVLEAGRDARVVSTLDRDPTRLKAAIDRIQARDVEGDLGAAVALAVDRLRQLGGARRILVLTDGNLARPGGLSGASLPIEVVTVGEPVDNAGIVRVDVRSGNDPVQHREQVQAFLVVANYGKQPREAYVTLRQDNASDLLASRRVLIPPGERIPVVLTFNPTPGDYGKGLLVEMAPGDALAVDDIAYARVPVGEKLPAYIASSDPSKISPWVERALVSDPMLALQKGSIQDLLSSPLDLGALVVIEGACPGNVPGGDLLLVNPPPGQCMGTLVGATIEHPTITSWDSGDPRMRFLTLDGVHVAKANLLKPDGTSQELIRTQLGTIGTDVSTPTRAGTLLGFDVGESDWPLKASFVLFMRNVIEQARTHRAHGITGPARAGEPMRVRLPASATSVEVTGPTGEKLDASARSGLAVVPEIQRVGLYRLSWQGPQGGSVVVPANLTSEAESDLRTKPIDASAGNVEVSNAGARPESHSEWAWVLAIVALAFVIADVWYLTRKPRTRAVGAPAKPAIPERRAA